ncbi:MAG TPA: AI-2E family transporter [Methylomirabilota bacterium]|jgi:predicted PurR-regulated permease PerM|nr:AI-2E family transporter [Methylomirabilota bacterium]
MNRSEGSFYPRVFALVTASLLGYALVSMALPFAGPILWALLLSSLLYPLHEALGRAIGGRPGLSALLLTLAGLLLILVPGALIAAAFARQAGELMATIQDLAERHHVAQLSDLTQIPVAERLIAWIASYAPITVDQVKVWLVQSGRTLLLTLMGASGAALASVLGAVLGLVLVLFLLFFFLRDGKELVRRAMRLVPMEEDRKDALLDHLSSVTRALVLGMLLTAAAQGALTGIGFALVGLPSPVVFGVLTGLASLIPLVGTAIVWLPAVIVLLAQGRTGAAIFLTVWSLGLVTSVDNVIKPLVVSGRAGLPTFAVFLGLVGGLAAFGAIGMFLGPVIVALTIALLRFAEESRAASTSGV